MITITEAQFRDLLDDAELVHVDDTWRHGSHRTYHVVFEGKDYLATVDCHASDGLQLYGSVDLYPAEKRTRTIEEWVQVKP